MTDSLDDINTTTIMVDNVDKNRDNACIVYKFQSRPPYEGFILILLIVLIAILLIWWLNSKS
jgi:hypothetical protein